MLFRSTHTLHNYTDNVARWVDAELPMPPAAEKEIAAHAARVDALQKKIAAAPDEAARFSLVLWGVVTLPLMLGGLISLAAAGLRLQDLRHEAKSDSALR